MAQKTTVELIDDVDGKPAAETIMFALDGKTFEIDLSAKNAKALRTACQPWIAAARRVSSRRGGAPARRVATGVDSSAVRAWAAANGLQISARGRIPGHVIERYHAAGN